MNRNPIQRTSLDLSYPVALPLFKELEDKSLRTICCLQALSFPTKISLHLSAQNNLSLLYFISVMKLSVMQDTIVSNCLCGDNQLKCPWQKKKKERKLDLVENTLFSERTIWP